MSGSVAPYDLGRASASLGVVQEIIQRILSHPDIEQPDYEAVRAIGDGIDAAASIISDLRQGALQEG